MEKLKVLVADDEYEMRSVIIRILQRKFANIEAHEAASGAEAERLLEEHCRSGRPFHIVITDTGLAEGHGAGLKVAEKAKALTESLKPAGKDTSVIGMGGVDCTKRYARRGAEGFLLKPCRGEHLVEAVRKHGFEKHGIPER